WDDLWLNEGFASWTQTYAADILFPEWGMWEQFTVDDQSSALRLDSLKTSHPIQVPIAHAEEVEQVFDAISYCKGACVVKMLHAVLGHDHFRQGLQASLSLAYMEKHKYSNTETYDLWNAWSEVSGRDIGQLMRSWTEQMGHPMIKVTKETWTPTSVTLELQQSWFLADGSEPEKGEAQLWTVPLLVSTGSGEKKAEVELMTEETYILEASCRNFEGDWVKINAGQHTLMRVLYTPEMMRRLEAGLRDRSIDPSDRAGLISDSYALVKAGHMGAEQLVHLLPAFKNEDNSTVWMAIEGVLVGLDKVLIADEVMHKRFTDMVAKLLAPVAKRVGWNPSRRDGHSGKLLRATVIGLLGRFSSDLPEVKEQATERFLAHVANPKEQVALPSEYAVPVYKVALKNGGKVEFRMLMSILEACETDAERKQVYSAIGFCPTEDLKCRVLEWAVSEVKLQDFFYPLLSVASSNKLGRDLTWEFFQKNFERIKGMLANASPSLMNAVIMYCCSFFTEKAKMEEVRVFFERNPLPNSTRKISQMLESMEISVEFYKKIASSPLATGEFWNNLQV
ncbi:unnamed protein product, partial [Discosporangium mesarthrocarpum]